jgi:t-SNARE complex subunit (syntaxin)
MATVVSTEVNIQPGRIDRSADFQKLAATRKASIQLGGVAQESAAPQRKRHSLFHRHRRAEEEAAAMSATITTAPLVLDAVKESNEAEQLMGMADFYAALPKIREQLAYLQNQRKEVTRANKQCQQALDDEEAVRCDEFVEAAVRHVHSLVSELKDKLESMDQGTTEAQQAYLTGINAETRDPNVEQCLTGYARIRQLLVRHYRQHLLKFMEDFQADQREADVRRKEQLERKIRIISPEISDRELTKIVADPQLNATQIFGSSVLAGDAREALQAFEQRRVSMFALERSVGKLAVLFRDMQNMLQEQGEMLTDCQKYLGSANEFLVQAKETLAEGKTYAKNVRKLKCAIF